ncbi:hypothetical protein V9L05_23885 (plasmid) [Bernardetia sp. Wsw4-3y2]|uniref:hypothetical protein n=1 Tax=Bernardetia sp. Wsw4-3y2 TaxID=3127471 RepID=UPI0030D23FFC
MKKRNCYLLFFVGFILLSFQFYQKNEVDDFDKERKLREVISKTQILELPLFLNVYEEEKSAKLIGLSQLINPNSRTDLIPILGILPDTTNYFTFLAYKAGDILYPTFVTFNKKGNLIDDKPILFHENFNIFEEVDLSYQTSTVNLSKTKRGLEITLLEIIKGKRYREFELNTENTNLTDSLFCQQVIQTGFLNENGKIIFDDKIIEDCR